MADQEETDTNLCSNCKRDIPSINFVMHQSHCHRNIKLCEHCQEPVPISEMDTHFDEEHKQMPCECGESVEISKLEEHKKNECKNRSMRCEYCDIDLPFCKIQEHKDFCGSRTELCELCNRYIQLKDLDVHVATECTYPEVPPKTTAKSSYMDESDSLHGLISPQWQGAFPDYDMQYSSGYPTRTTSLFPHLISPTRGWNPQLDELAMGGNRRRTSGATDRRHRKNQDRVQNSFGVTGKKKATTSSSAASGLSRPWEKNDERQQNLSQEESDRLLAMHLAQDLTGGSSLSPVEHPNLFSTKSDTFGISDINDMLKQAYDVPAVNTFQEPKHTQSSPADNTTMLPCEFCQQPFPPDNLIEHMSGCRPDVASYPSPTKSSANNKRQTSSTHVTSLGPQVLDNLGQSMPQQWMPSNNESDRTPTGDADDIMLPCEFCGDLLPFEYLSHHQVNCTENGSQTPLPPDVDNRSLIRNPIRSSPTRIRPRRLPVPTSLDVHPRPTKHQAEPSLDVLMASPDSKPTKDIQASPQPRHGSQSRNRKTKVSSTVTRPGGHDVNVTTASPVEKYMNGSLYDRNGKVAKPRVVSVERKVRGAPGHGKTIRSQHLVQKANNDEDVDVVTIDKDFDDEIPTLLGKPSSVRKGKSTLAANFNTNLHTQPKDLNNRQKLSTSGKPRPKAIKKSNLESEEGLYEPSFGARDERQRISRENNARQPSRKPSNKSRHTVGRVNLQVDDDLGPPLRLRTDDLDPPLRLKTSNPTPGGAKPKTKKPSRKHDGDLV